MKRFYLYYVRHHAFLKYAVKANEFYYLYLSSIIRPEIKDASNIVLNSSDSRSNRRAIAVVVEPTTDFVYIYQNVFDFHFANPYQIKINLNPDSDYGLLNRRRLNMCYSSLCLTITRAAAVVLHTFFKVSIAQLIHQTILPPHGL